MNKKKQLNKLQRGLMIYSVIACVAILLLFGTNMIMSWNLGEGEVLPYFNRHFLTPIGFTLMGTVCVCSIFVNKTATGDPGSDRMMKIVSLLFFVMAIVTLVISYIKM